MSWADRLGIDHTHAEADRALISQQKLIHLPLDVFMFLKSCCFYFRQYFCSFLIQELFVDEKCFCCNNSWCDLKGLLKYFIAFLKGYSWLATVYNCHRSASIWNPFTEVQGSGFHARCRDHFSQHPFGALLPGDNSVVALNSTSER